MKSKKSKQILSTADKKLISRNRIITVLWIFIIVSIAFNIIYIFDFKVPLINPDGEPRIKNESSDDNSKPSLMQKVMKDNSQFESFTSVHLNAPKGSYYFSINDEVCRVYGVEGFDFEYCDFELSKWNDLKDLVLMYQLEEYDPNKHVDSEGRIENFDEEYVLELSFGLKTKKMEIPENIADIETYMMDLTELARTKRDK